MVSACTEPADHQPARLPLCLGPEGVGFFGGWSRRLGEAPPFPSPTALHQQGGPPGLSWGSALGACAGPGAGGEDVPRLSRCFPCTHGTAGRDSTRRGRVRHRASERRRTLMGGRGQGRWCVLRGLRRARGNEMPGMPRRCPMPAAHPPRSPFAQSPRLDPRSHLCLQPGPLRGLPAPGVPARGDKWSPGVPPHVPSLF